MGEREGRRKKELVSWGKNATIYVVTYRERKDNASALYDTTLLLENR